MDASSYSHNHTRSHFYRKGNKTVTWQTKNILCVEHEGTVHRAIEIECGKERERESERKEGPSHPITDDGNHRWDRNDKFIFYGKWNGRVDESEMPSKKFIFIHNVL